MNKTFFIFVFLTTTYSSQVTFVVNMAEETVVAGDGDYPAVYLQELISTVLAVLR